MSRIVFLLLLSALLCFGTISTSLVKDSVFENISVFLRSFIYKLDYKCRVMSGLHSRYEDHAVQKLVFLNNYAECINNHIPLDHVKEAPAYLIKNLSSVGNLFSAWLLVDSTITAFTWNPIVASYPVEVILHPFSVETLTKIRQDRIEEGLANACLHSQTETKQALRRAYLIDPAKWLAQAHPPPSSCYKPHKIRYALLLERHNRINGHNWEVGLIVKLLLGAIASMADKAKAKLPVVFRTLFPKSELTAIRAPYACTNLFDHTVGLGQIIDERPFALIYERAECMQPLLGVYGNPGCLRIGRTTQEKCLAKGKPIAIFLSNWEQYSLEAARSLLRTYNFYIKHPNVPLLLSAADLDKLAQETVRDIAFPNFVDSEALAKVAQPMFCPSSVLVDINVAALLE